MPRFIPASPHIILNVFAESVCVDHNLPTESCSISSLLGCSLLGRWDMSSRGATSSAVLHTLCDCGVCISKIDQCIINVH